MNKSMLALAVTCFVLVLLWPVGCRQECGTRGSPGEWPASGYYALFEAVGEYFHAWIDSVEGIARIEDWLAGDPRADQLGIPGGPIELESKFNPGYSYRLKPDAVSFGEVWIEVCDAAPCYVEKDPDGWFENPNTWCPWAARVQIVWDCSNGTGSSCGSPVFGGGS